MKIIKNTRFLFCLISAVGKCGSIVWFDILHTVIYVFLIYLTVNMKSYISGHRKSHNQELLKHIPPFYDVPRPDNEL